MRVDNWTKVLNESLAEAEKIDFSWGEFDCFYWTDWVVTKLTGEETMKDFFAKRGFTPKSRPYMSTKGMQRLTKKLDCENFFELICKMYGPPISPKKAQRGDLVMVKLPDVFMPTLGVCRGIDVMFKTREENVYVPVTKCQYAWRVE